MSNTTTWAVLTDGRYIRVLINKPPAKSLNTLKADDSEALAKLAYHVVTGVKHGASNGTASREKSNMQLLADFLAEQLQEDMFQHLVLAAPASKFGELLGELKDTVRDVLAAEVNKDLLPLSIDEIEKELSGVLPQK